VPRKLQSEIDRASRNAREESQYQNAINAQIAANRAIRRDKRDITDSVQNAACKPYDATHNADDVRKSRRSSDSIERHKSDTAHVVSDTTILDGNRVIAVKRSSSKLIVRNADGTPNTTDTLAVVSHWRNHRASRKGQ
jgi:hypothetical protein